MKDFLANADWTSAPVRSDFDRRFLHVEAAKGSDFWRGTHYGFNRDSGHALLAPIEEDASLEVTFQASFSGLYDQAGLMIRNDEADWLKAGIEVSDGIPNAAVVVTRKQSDWSLCPVPEWAEREVTLRASWRAGAVTLRANVGDSPWNMLRLAPFYGQHVNESWIVCLPSRTSRFHGNVFAR